MQSDKSFNKLKPSLTVIFCLAIVTFLPFLAYKTYFADSEIWSVNLGYHLTDEFKNFWVFSRFLFYAFIFIFTRIFSDPEWVFFSARLLMCLNAIIQVFLVRSILQHFFRSRFIPWFGVFIMLSNSFFLTQSYRIRSDLLATTAVLLTIYGFLKYPLYRKRAILIGTLITVLMTPKAVFLLPILALIYVEDIGNSKHWTRLAWLGALVVTLFVSSLYLRLGVFSDLALDLNGYLLNAIQGGPGMPSYLSEKSFTYIQKLFSENAWLYLLWVAPYIFIFSSVIKVSDKKIYLVWIFVHSYLLLLLFAFPEKLPFFICGLIPLLSCSSAILIGLGGSSLKQPRYLNFCLLFGVILIFCVTAKKIMTFMNEDSNKEQISAIRYLDEYLKRSPELRYYDIVGLNPARAYFRHFAGPNQPETNKLIAGIVMQESPDLIMKVTKFNFFGAEMYNFLLENYIEIGNGFLLKSFPVPAEFQSEKEFFKLKDKQSLSFISPLFEKYKDSDLVFEAESKKGNSFIFSGKKDFLDNKPKGDLKIIKVTPFPLPEKMPPRGLDELFRFDFDF